MSAGSPPGAGRPGASFIGLVLPFLAFGALALGLARLAFLASYLPADGLRSADLPAALITGARFDLKLLTLLGLVLLGLGATLARWLPSRRARIALAVCVALAYAAPLLAQISQHYYYRYFQSAFTPIVFGFAEDDTGAVLDLIWKDYPVVALVALWLAASTVLTALTLRAHDALVARQAVGARRGSWRRALGRMLMLALLAVLARGSLGTFPLRRPDAEVSAHPTLNDSVRTGLVALYDAWHDRRVSVPRIETADEGLARFGYARAQDAARVLGLEAADDAALEAALYVRSPVNPVAAAHPPHVVVALMESWSAALMGFHEPGRNDLLGRMAPWRQRDLWFDHVYPVHGGTHPTLEGLLLNSPLTPLTQGRYAQHAFGTAAARPFHDAGYRTVFVYGGPTSWRQIGTAFERQGFDAVLGEPQIEDALPEAQHNRWGVYDEYLVRYVGDLLDQADRDGRPLFLVFLTTTHHPPHALPPGAATGPLDPDRLRGRLQPSSELGLPLLQTYRYASDQLGALLDRIAAAPYAGRTIVAATADHNMKSVFAYEQPRQWQDMHGVPLYLHVPPAYLGDRRPVPGRFASHADLMPTLYGLALSEARHLDAGQSLLAPVAADRDVGITMYDTLFSAEGVAHPLFGATRWYRWTDPARHELAPDAAPSAALQRRVERSRAMIALQDWAIRRDVLLRP